MAERQIMQKQPPKAKKPEDRTKEMSFLEHLEELRWRIIKGLVGVLVGVGVAFFFSDFLINEILLGPSKADFFMYEIMKMDAIDLTLQSRRLPGQFFAFWGVLFVIGFIIGSPIFFYQVWSFVEPAFEVSTKRKTVMSAFFITLCFLIGVSFGYLILVPFALQFFTQFQISDVIRNDFDINNYFSLFTTWVLSCGLIFQIPVFSYSLSRIGILTPDIMRRFRRHAVVACLVLAAFLTPPDPISQILIGVPLLLLYELSIWISKLAVRQRKKQLEKTFSE